MAEKKNPFIGTWRITEMEHWDLDFIDAEEEGYIEFDRSGQGDFQFGYVHGSIDTEISMVEGKLRSEFSWAGNDEMDEVSGRGWAIIEKDGSLYGQIIFHIGERSWFRAVRKESS
jgi:hypothetical protein